MAPKGFRMKINWLDTYPQLKFISKWAGLNGKSGRFGWKNDSICFQRPIKGVYNRNKLSLG
jgi:hypothetical protein